MPLAIEAAVALTLAWLVLRGPQPSAASRRMLAMARWWPCVARVATRARVIGVITAVARRHPLKPQCLEQSLAASALLGGRVTDAQILVGVRRTSDGLSAHAWLPLSGETDEGHVPLAGLSAKGWTRAPR